MYRSEKQKKAILDAINLATDRLLAMPEAELRKKLQDDMQEIESGWLGIRD